MALLQRHRHQDHKDHHENKFLHSIRSFGDIGRTNSASKHMDMSDPAVSNSTDGSSHHYGNRLTANFPFSAPNLLGRMGRRFSNASAHSAGEEGGARGNGNGNGRNGNGNGNGHGRNGNGNGGSDSHLEEEATGGSGEELYSAPKVGTPSQCTPSLPHILTLQLLTPSYSYITFTHTFQHCTPHHFTRSQCTPSLPHILTLQLDPHTLIFLLTHTFQHCTPHPIP